MEGAETASTQWFQRVWNERDDAAIEELLAPDAVVHGLGHPNIDVRGPAAFREYRDGVLRAFPDVRMEIVQSVNTEDAEAVLFYVSGTHLGEFMGVPATGRRVAFHGMGMSRLADGKLLEAWNVVDFHACLQQLTEPST